jgi:choline kinase
MSNATYMALVQNINSPPLNKEFIINSEYVKTNIVSCLSEQVFAAVQTV